MLKPIILWIFLAIVGMGMYYVQAHRHILPGEFKIYIKPNGQVSSNPSGDSTEKVLPTLVDYEGFYGCYIACYSADNQKAIYTVEPSINVIGLIRVQGKYKGSRCIAYSYQDNGGNTEEEAEGLAAVCTKHFPNSCADHSCWGKGDTGQWFNLKD